MSAPCCPCVGSTVVTKPRPSWFAMTLPATESADITSRPTIPSARPTAISEIAIPTSRAGLVASTS